MFRLQSIRNSNLRSDRAARHSSESCEVIFRFEQQTFVPNDHHQSHDWLLQSISRICRSLQVTKSVMSLLNYYGWNKFSIIYEEAWGKVAESLSLQAKSWNKTINHKKQVVDRHKCCENNMKCCEPGYWFNVSFLALFLMLFKIFFSLFLWFHSRGTFPARKSTWSSGAFVDYVTLSALILQTPAGVLIYGARKCSLSITNIIGGIH